MITNALILAIIFVESGGDCSAFNASENAVGPMQIRPCVVEDMRRVGLDFKHEDCYELEASIEIFRTYCEMYGADTPEHKARNWNGGPDGHEENCTLGYWAKVKKRLKGS